MAGDFDGILALSRRMFGSADTIAAVVQAS